ncbi:MAG: hypothetical protein ABIN97_09165 [Ginsengibacter sp.]
MSFDVYKCFLPECNLDTLLVEVLLEKTFSVNHQKGNSSIAARMNKGSLQNSFAVGIIDEDKVKLRALENFREIKKLTKNGLKFFEPIDRSKHHYFIQICPAIERWILSESKKGEINIADEKYKLPNTLGGLVKLKSSLQKNDQRFKLLFLDMLTNENCDEIITLKKWLLFLRKHHYNSNLELL